MPNQQSKNEPVVPITGVIRAGFGGEAIRQAIERANAERERIIAEMPEIAYMTDEQDREIYGPVENLS